jgi:hypothetical protein
VNLEQLSCPRVLKKSENIIQNRHGKAKCENANQQCKCKRAINAMQRVCQ